MKKIIPIMLIVVLLLSMNLNVMADNTKSKQEEPILIQSQVFAPDNTLDSSQKVDSQTDVVIIPQSDVYQPGTIKIDDVLLNEGGYTQGDYKAFSSFETFKYAAVKIATQLPVIGDWIETLMDIYDALKGVYTDMVYIDNSRAVEVLTKFTYRDFYHYLYAWDYSNYWKKVGQSLSRYYYKNLTMWYYSNIGEYRQRNFAFSHLNGYAPFHIAEAPNYMNYTQLSSNAYEAWIYNTQFNESYPNY